jgi:hypothetical protein
MEEQIERRRPGRPPRADRAPVRPERTSARASADEFGMFRDFDNYSTLPSVPDTRDWHYCWVRVSVNGAPDGKNIGKYMRGPVRYETVPASEFDDLQQFRATHAAGGNGDVIQIDDVVLMRCRQDLHQKQKRFYDYRASQQREALRAETNDRFREAAKHGVHLTYSDKEEGGVQTVTPGEEDDE